MSDVKYMCLEERKVKKGINSIISGLAGIAIGAGAVGKAMIEEKGKVKSMSDKHLALFLMMNQWVKIKQEGKHLVSYFEKNGYKRIAIYGMSYAGETLVEELKGTDIQIAYGIDRNADFIYGDVDIVSMEEDLGKVDVIVVTAITFFDEIEEELLKKVSCPVISLEDILYEV